MAIDAVLYLDRLDLYRVEPLDKRMMQAVSDTFGPAIWKKAVIGLTHGNMQQAPPGATFGGWPGCAGAGAACCGLAAGLSDIRMWQLLPSYHQGAGATASCAHCNGALHPWHQHSLCPSRPSASLTHACCACCAAESFSRRRQQLLRGAIRRPLFRPALPSVLIENSETCPRDPSTRHRCAPAAAAAAGAAVSCNDSLLGRVQHVLDAC